MAAITFDNKNRNVIPRWRDSRVRETRERESLGLYEPRLANYQEFDDRLREWKEQPSAITALEVVAASAVFDKSEAAEGAARYLLQTQRNLPAALTSLSQALSGASGQRTDEPELSAGTNLRRLRARLRLYPENAIAWADLSRECVNIGEIKRALRAMQVALAISPNNRFILRSAARLYLHANLPDRAHQVLVNAPSTSSDPWLMAAELAIAPIAEASPEFAFEGRSVLSAGKFAPIHLTELASALATLEITNGNRKRARKLFEHALECPTENTVAQVDWATGLVGEIPRDQNLLKSVPRTYEALTFQYFQKRKWSESLDQAEKWREDQPFSARPSVHASFLCTSVVEDFARAERITAAGLRANPADFTLLNNRAVALAKMGRTTEAMKSLSYVNRSSLSESEKIVFLATSGLLHFRSKNFEAGRKLYAEAVAIAEQKKLPEVRDRASIYLALEEIDHRTLEAARALRKAVEISERSSDPINDSLLQLVIDHAEKSLR